ncbi:hypothetical protein K492DRAFT_238185 [Lichtheimia hyalospora FSU 10163]|nr:hypothetical protein K492DRAFT_238185 [Lichtheimia hyalospora FSU 10163]
MPLFNFRKKKVDTTTTTLRKTKSTGNILSAPTTNPATAAALAAATAASSKPAPTPIIIKSTPASPVLKPSNTTHKDTTATGSTSSSGNSSSESDDEMGDSSNSSDDDASSIASLPPTTRNTQHHHSSHMTVPRVAMKKSNSSPSTPHEIDNHNPNRSYFSPNDLDRLLSMETEARIEAQEKKKAEEDAKPTRPTRLKFELPETPSRSRSPAAGAYSAYSRPRQRWSLPDEKMLHQRGKKKKKARKSRWSKIMGSDDDDDDAPRPFQIGDKVRLLHRPLPIHGFIRYMGPVNFDTGDDWLGIELDSRVGKNDGSVEGKRYFQTDPHRGIFLRKSEVEFV